MTIDLTVTGLRMQFGGNEVLSDVSCTFDHPEICGLIGPNGAGKSTLTNILSGVLRPTGGAVLLHGERIDGLPPYAIARRGLGRTFQISRAFKRMTVIENLMVPAHAAGSSDGDRTTRAIEALELLSIDHLRGELARSLSGGQLKLLELARLLMLEASILVLDEPFAGVHPKLREHVSAYIRHLHQQGKLVIIIEHDMDALFAVCQRVLVLAQGRVIADGPPDSIRSDPLVIEAYLGSEPAADDRGTGGHE